MISRRLKQFYYSAFQFPMLLNWVIYRFVRAPSKGQIKVHLGPGQKNYISEWINVDANKVTCKCDVWADISHGLPFRDRSVDCFYSHHVIEHLPDTFLITHFQDMFRCLKPGGGMIRVGGPNGDSAIRKFVENDFSWFSNWPDKRSSIGGKFANVIFCRNEHLTILTESYLTELARDAGFEDVAVCTAGLDTGRKDIIGNEVLATENEPTPDAPKTLLIEATKPKK